MNARIETRADLKTATPKPDRLFSTLHREHGFEPLRIEGTIPPSLKGTLYRVGPAVFESQGRTYGHPFEGDGAVCAVRIQGSGAEGAHRVVQSEGLLEERDAGFPLYGTVASWPRRVMNGFRRKVKNAANTNVMVWQDKLFAMYELTHATELSLDLETKGERRFKANEYAAFSAHPHRVAKREAIYNFGVRYGATSYIDLYELPDVGPARCFGSVPLEAPVMLHDFIATERHMIFFVSPAMIRLSRILLGLNPLDEIVGWEPQRGTDVIVVPIDDPASFTRFTVDAFYQWHFGNAFERNGEIIIDFVKYENLDTLHELNANQLDAISGGQLTRARIDLQHKRLHQETLDEQSSEFPRIDPRYEGSEHSRLWLFQGPTLTQHNVVTGERIEHELGADQSASEPIFVPRNSAAPEGDGWILSLIYDGASATSHVTIIDTARFDDEPVARIWFDHHVPITFHGVWTEHV